MNDKEICPNPNGELGICYKFDRFGDRCGCVGCKLLETLPNGMMNEGDPLPGLTKQLTEANKLYLIKCLCEEERKYIQTLENFYKSAQEKPDDFASEFTLLLQRYMFVDKVLKIIGEENGKDKD